ncbi:thiol reductant ABC exporter subunit CydD [Arcanobacterium haemolyticum]|nr:thiol reductant ABC exporter subunit CydD [Arcanobacterium haemolyticum]
MKPLDPRLMRYARDARTYIIFLSAAGLIAAILVIAQSMLIAGAASPIIDGDKTFTDVLDLIAWLVGVFAARMLVTYLQEAYGHRAALRVIADLRTKTLRHAGDLGERWLAQGHTSSTVTLVTDGLDDLEPYFVKFLPQLILTATVTPIALAVILWLDLVSAIAIVICIPLIPIFMILIGKMTQSYSEKRLASMQKLGQQLLDLLAGLTTLKALGREQGPRQRVKDLGEDYAAKTMQTLYVAFLSGAALEFLATLSTALVAVEVGLRMVGGHLDLYAGLTVIMLTPEVFKPLREVGSQFHASADGVAASAQVFDLLDLDVPVSDGSTTAPDLSSSTITIDDLSVLAPGRATIAPAHLSATIAPGTVTALVGKSGSGKSTTASVLLKLLEPTSGSIHVEGIPLDEISEESWWRQITWVPQRPVIVPGTVADNVGQGDSPARREAAQLTGFADVVESLPNGWDTLIGQGGAGLSVGQRQRLALTRALIEARPLVVLDEPSAHLDALSERHVVRAVEQLRATGHTVLVIAHRPSIVDIADSVITVSSDREEVSQ